MDVHPSRKINAARPTVNPGSNTNNSVSNGNNGSVPAFPKEKGSAATLTSSADEIILAHLNARKGLLHACLALRDAFTNKQRQRRLTALAKLRTYQASNSAGAATEVTVDRSQGGDDNHSLSPPQTPPTAVEFSVTETDGKEVVAAAERLATITIDGGGGEDDDGGDGCPMAKVAGKKAWESSGEGELTVVVDQAHENGGGQVTAADAGEVPCSKEVRGGRGGGGGKYTELAIEGRAVAIKTPTAPAMEAVGLQEGKSLEDNNDSGDGDDDDDVEAPLEGITRCRRYLRDTAVAFDSLLLSMEASAQEQRDVNLVSPADLTPVKTISPAPRNCPSEESIAGVAKAGSGKGENISSGNATKTAKEENSNSATVATAFRIGGEAGAFAFEPEINQHLLGSSPHHHVHFRRGGGDGARTLRCLAQETERACGVVGCRDLSDVRRYLLRFSQMPTEV